MSVEWLTRAVCRDMPSAVFFPNEANSTAVAEARAICLGCPVRRECLQDAFDTERDDWDRHGIRGALSGRQRRAVSKGSDIETLEMTIPIGPTKEALQRAVEAGHPPIVLAAISGISRKTIYSIRSDKGRAIVTLAVAEAIAAAVEGLLGGDGAAEQQADEVAA